jgi:NADH-quinone oxidoreductase subunit H
VIVAGSMNLNGVALQQKGGIWNWYVFHDPFTFGAFWTYFTCAMASCKRAVPFELTDVLGLWVGNIINVLVFLFKGWFLVFVMMWVRWTLPRLRIDQVMMTCLKYLLPISCVLVMGVSLWSLLVPAVVQAYFHWVMLTLCVVAILLFVMKLFSWASAPPGTGMPGMWTTMTVPGYQGGKK